MHKNAIDTADFACSNSSVPSATVTSTALPIGMFLTTCSDVAITGHIKLQCTADTVAHGMLMTAFSSTALTGNLMVKVSTNDCPAAETQHSLIEHAVHAGSTLASHHAVPLSSLLYSQCAQSYKFTYLELAHQSNLSNLQAGMCQSLLPQQILLFASCCTLNLNSHLSSVLSQLVYDELFVLSTGRCQKAQAGHK